jgi:catechol 2,3-dioxygenase-like lactoylglutathione lyase family enzyme
MSTAKLKTTKATDGPEMDAEVAVVPVSDADRAKQFYAALGWREDADFPISEDLRVLQFTPPGSQTSVLFGTRATPAGAAPAGRMRPSRPRRSPTTT